MNPWTPMLALVSFGHDSGLFSQRGESVERQLLYCQRLRLKQTILVRAKNGERGIRHGAALSVHSCYSPHWAIYPFTAIYHALFLVRKRPDLVTAQDAFLSALPAAFMAAVWQCPLIIGVFSDEIDNPDLKRERPCYALLNRLAKYLLSRAAAIRTDSAEMAGKLRRIGFPHVRFIPFLILHQEAFLSVRHNPDGSTFRLLAIARLEVQKNLGLAIEALGTLSKSYRAVLDIVGDGSQRAALEAHAKALGVSHIVRFHGTCPFEALPAFLANADVLILTSHHETAARVLVLAALAGVPAVTTATTGSAEVVADGVTGFIVPLNDKATLTSRLDRLASDPGLRIRLGESARTAAITRFGRARVLAGLAEMYRSV